MAQQSSTPFFRPGGTLDPSAESYVVREADDKLFEALARGEYVYLLDSRQKGKSSLVARTIQRLKREGVITIKLDLQRIGANVSPDQWYAGLLAGLGQDLGLHKELFEYWSAHQQVGPLARFAGAIASVLLPQSTGSLVIIIDEIDFVRSVEFSTDEFFACIRDFYNRRHSDTAFSRLTFCLVGVATPGQLIRNSEVSPFNIGTRIELSDFALGEYGQFARALDVYGKDGARLIERIHYWLGGHPYLTQLVCSQAVADPSLRSVEALDGLVKRLFLSPEARQREPNLADVERRLLEPDIPGLAPEEARTQVLQLLGLLLQGRLINAVEPNPVIATLRLSGVSTEQDGKLRIRNRLYQLIFDERWRRRNMPDAESRRLKAAAHVAMLRTALVAGVIVVAVSSAAVGMWQLSSERQGALNALKKRTEDVSRISSERQRSLSALEAKSAELARASNDREKSLEALVKLTTDLKAASQQRARALSILRSKNDALTRSSYLQDMALISAETSLNRWMNVAAAVSRASTNPLRGWEWGYAALAIDFDGRTAQFPKWSSLEPQAMGNPNVATPRGLYDTNSLRPKLVASFDQSRSFTLQYRRGPFRVQMVDATRSDSIRDAFTQRLLVPNRVYASIMDVDPKSRTYLLASDENLETVELRTIDDDRVVTSYRGPDNTHAAQFLPDGTILSIHETRSPGVAEIIHWDRRGRMLDHGGSDQQFAQGLSISQDGQRYVAWGFDEKVEVRALHGHVKISSLVGHPKRISALTFSADGDQILTGCDDGIVRLFDVKTGHLLRRFLGHRYPILQVSFLPDRKGWASIDTEGGFHVWNSTTPRAMDEYRDHSKLVTGATLDRARLTLISASTDGTIVSRDLVSGAVVRRSAPVRSEMRGPLVAREPSSGDVFVATAEGALERWDGKTLRTLKSVKPFAKELEVLDTTPGGRQILVGSSDHKYALFDGHTLHRMARIEPAATRKPVDANGVTISPCYTCDAETRQIALYLGETGEIQVYSTEDGRMVKQWSPGRTVISMAFASRGRQLVASLGAAWWVRDGQTVVYDVASGRVNREFGHQGRVMKMLVYSPASQILAGVSGDQNPNDKAVFLWDMTTGQKLGELNAHDGTQDVSFSPDGTRILTNSIDDGSMHVWNSRTCEELLRLRFPSLPSLGWAGRGHFSPDGRSVIQSSFDGFVRLWNSRRWK